MKIAIALVALGGLLAIPALPAQAATPTSAAVPSPIATSAPSAAAAALTPAAPTSAVKAAPSPVAGPAPILLVARYTFDGGAVSGLVADTSGHGPALTIRSADQGAVQFLSGAQGGQYVSFPDACATGAPTCPRDLLEAPNSANFNPGTHLFRWSARVHLTKAQLHGSANVVQKGVAGSGSQWKMQIGATQGRAQCVVSGTGSATSYLVRSTNTVADAVWHKILCQRDGTTLSVYVDDTLRGQIAIPADLSITNTLPTRIGGANFNQGSDMYHGQLDDVYAELG